MMRYSAMGLALSRYGNEEQHGCVAMLQFSAHKTSLAKDDGQTKFVQSYTRGTDDHQAAHAISA
jgi:hypothetical protein